jgi:hypothetical protein
MEAFTTATLEQLAQRVEQRAHRVRRAELEHPAVRDLPAEREREAARAPEATRAHPAQTQAKAGNQPATPLSLTLQPHRMLQHPAALANAYSTFAGT